MIFPFPIDAIALEHRVATVEAVVRELAQKTGQDLRLRPEMRDEVLYLSLKPHDAGTLMALVAKAASAQWFQDEGHTWLGRPAAFWRAQERRDREGFAREVATRLAPLLAPADAALWVPGYDAAGRAAAYLQNRTSAQQADVAADCARMRALEPAGRFASRVLRAFPLEAIAAVPLGHVGRFAFRPTGRLSPLTGTTLASVRQYLEERRTFVAGLEGLPGGPGRVVGSLMLFDLTVPTPATEPKILLTVIRSRSNVGLNLRVSDARGRQLDGTWVTLSGVSSAEAATARALPGYAAWQARKVVLGPAARWFRDPADDKPDPAQIALLRDPVAHEPLAAAMLDPMDALAAATGAEMAVALPDTTYSGAWIEDGGLLGDFAQGLATQCDLRTEDGVIVGPARRPTEAAGTKMSRTALAGLFREFGRGFPRLDPLARYALAQNPDAEATWFEEATAWAAGFRHVRHDGLFDAPGRDALRVYGGLSPAQREALRGGGSVTVGSLSPGARRDLERCAFGRDATVNRERPNGSNEETTLDQLIDALRPEMWLVGLPGGQQPLVAYGKGGWFETEGAEFLGHILAVRERTTDPEEFPSAWPNPLKERFIPGMQTDLPFALEIAPGVRAELALDDVDLDVSAKAVPYGALPEAHRAAIRKGRENG